MYLLWKASNLVALPQDIPSQQDDTLPDICGYRSVLSGIRALCSSVSILLCAAYWAAVELDRRAAMQQA